MKTTRCDFGLSQRKDDRCVRNVLKYLVIKQKKCSWVTLREKSNQILTAAAVTYVYNPFCRIAFHISALFFHECVHSPLPLEVFQCKVAAPWPQL